VGVVIERYTRPAMGRVWSDEEKYATWLRVELAVCEAYARRGRIPSDALARIRTRAHVDLPRIQAIQARVKHEMIALLTSLEEQLGADSRFVHQGLTSNDVWDTALALQLGRAAELVIAGQERLRTALAALARRYKDTVIVGRTHGVHAEPTTFGLRPPCGTRRPAATWSGCSGPARRSWWGSSRGRWATSPMSIPMWKRRCVESSASPRRP
jgi:adenylosuccinate lyase